ncbi:amidohydrolase [Phenylobacterium montanum]|uniref:Amidohydrolase n=1 Tax=Phenylobacterium montanum TaxID=2823693 RepID=A0A975FWW8_9CAUL|nr:amidohydrolase [Caulobacter sp. S6]QUD86785.1 amidohydrolase [Caulobacter sp. S6]
MNQHNTNLSRRSILALGAAVAAAPVIGRAQAPGLVLTGGPIYTGLKDVQTVQAVAIQAGRFAYVGDLAGAKAAAPGGRVIDLGGSAAYPGFVDCHAHLTEIGLREMTLNLEGSASIVEVQSRLKAAAAQQPAGPLFGRGWIETHWPEHRFPTRADLDAVVADRPVMLERADGHAVVVNSKAIQLAGITASTPNPAGGEILRQAGGEPNGMFVDNAMDLVKTVFPKPDQAMKRQALGLADKLYCSRGWTGVHSMSVAQDELDILRGMAGQGTLRLRVDNFMDLDQADEVLRTGPTVDPTGRVHLRGIKLYADGALGSRGAALLAPYSDKPGSVGLEVMSHDTIVGAMQKAKAVNAQVATHAIGDRGNRNTLNAIAEVLGSGHNDRRWRIEHSQILSLEDLPRFAAMGVIASMQPSHAIGDLYFAPARLGPDRLKGAYAWKSLLASGAVVCGGTDAPVEKGDPLIEYYAACYRHALNGFAGPDWGLDEAVSRAQALNLFTGAAAYGIFSEKELGSIEVGKRADVSVFSKDLMTVDPAEIPKAKATLTIVDGQVAHQG